MVEDRKTKVREKAEIIEISNDSVLQILQSKKLVHEKAFSQMVAVFAHNGTKQHCIDDSGRYLVLITDY